MNRRTFTRTAISAAAVASLPAITLANHHETNSGASHSKNSFKMKFAPHLGHFKHAAGKEILDQIRYAHDQGFTAWEDNRMPGREPSEQKAIGALLQQLGMTMGTFVIYVDMKNPVLSGNRLDASKRARDPKAVRELLRKKITAGIEVSKRCGAKWSTFVPAIADASVPLEYQTANVVDHLKFCAELCEPSGLTLILEPLNAVSHPGIFLQRISHAHQICKMVDSPSVKILDDLFHQQTTEGNLIANMKAAWDEIAYIQVGDVPGRKEPNTGEINFANIIHWLDEKGYEGIIGMEHGIKNREPEGEQALIQAYRSIDAKS
ncbi:MAG: hydroxypyruvate isomerase family protein [Verrucomicrobiia bacterium]